MRVRAATKQQIRVAVLIICACAISIGVDRLFLESFLPRSSNGLASAGPFDGRWEIVEGYQHKEWQTFSEACQLTDRLSERGVKLDKKDQPSNATRKLYILEYGDSVDRVLLEDLCAIGKGKKTDCWVAPGRDPYSFCMNACELPTMTIVRQHMWGVAHEGPYHLSKNGSPQDRVTHGWDVFKNNTGHDPDVVIFSSALWDIARFVEHHPSILEGRDDVPHRELEKFMANTTEVLDMIEGRALPSTLLVYHTTAFAAKDDADPKQHSHKVLGRHGHLVQVNAAGRQVAADRGWALVDFEAMAQWYAQPKEYLRDSHHPNMPFLNNVVNIYLNIWHDFFEDFLKFPI